MGQLTIERAFALVGQFINSWSLVSKNASNAIAEALDLNFTQSLIFSGILSTDRRKLELLQELTDCSLLDENDKKHFTEQMTRLNSLLTARNLMAHNSILVSDDGSTVQFWRGRSKKGKPEHIVEKWSELDFVVRNGELLNLMPELDSLGTKLKQNKAGNSLAEILGSSQARPKGSMFQTVQ